MKVRENFDIGVIGAGVVGGSIAYHLAREGGRSVVLIDAGHDRRQSEGKERASSFAYETEWRIKLARQQHEGWRDLERVSGEKVFFQTGGIDLGEGEEECAPILRTRDAMRLSGVDYEEWDRNALRRKVPAWHVKENATALYSPGDGILCPTLAVLVLIEQARRFGARIRDREPVVGIKYGGPRIEVVTNKGRYGVKDLVIACGIWTNELLAHLGLSLPISTSQAQTVYFPPRENRAVFSSRFFPMWFHHKKPAVYGFPMFIEQGIKIAFQHDGLKVDIQDYTGEPSELVTERLRSSYVELYLPDAAGKPFGAHTCLYDDTPDGYPYVGKVPGREGLYVAAGSNGAGFAPAIAIGKGVSDLIHCGRTDIRIENFGIGRLAQERG